MVCRTVTVLMTLSELQGHSSVAFLNVIFHIVLQ